jgi:transcriptional regulator with XRE-family HTH domain
LVVIDTDRVAVHPIRVVRVIRGWTQQELERRAGLPATVLSRIERGRRVPDPAMQLRIAMALDQDVGDLFPRHRETIRTAA